MSQHAEQNTQQPEDVEGANAEGLSKRAIEDPSNVVVDIERPQKHSECDKQRLSIHNPLSSGISTQRTGVCRHIKPCGRQRDNSMVQIQNVADEPSFPEFRPSHSRQAIPEHLILPCITIRIHQVFAVHNLLPMANKDSLNSAV